MNRSKGVKEEFSRSQTCSAAILGGWRLAGSEAVGGMGKRISPGIFFDRRRPL
jgi:hypothetical protein